MIFTNKSVTKITSFTIIKEIQFLDVSSAIVTERNLIKLKDEDFNRIITPSFNVNRSNDKVTIESEFIKGTFIDLRHMDILYEDLVIRDSMWSKGDFYFENYIIRDEKIYAVDIDDYGMIPHEDRLAQWQKVKQTEIGRLRELNQSVWK